MAKCQNCGSMVKEGARFCTKCGAKITLISPEFTAQVDILKKRIERDSLNPKLYVEIGLMYLQNNFLQEALIEFQKAVSIDNSEYEAHLRSGEIYLDLEDLDKAESSYQKALNLNPTSPEVKLGLFRVYHLRRKAEEGIRLGEELIQADPNNLEVHKALKEMYNEKGMREETFRELLTITALAPNDKESLEELAGFYEEREDNENEIKCYQKILELDPKDVVSRFNLGKSFCLKGDYQKAIEYLKNIVEKMAHPFESYGHLYLALSYAGQQDFDNAIQEIGYTSPLDYEELTDNDKKLLAEAHYKIGCGILQRKLLYSAIDYVQKAIKYDPQNTEYPEQLNAIKINLREKKRKTRKKAIFVFLGLVILGIGAFLYFHFTKGTLVLRIKQSSIAGSLYVDGKYKGKVFDKKKTMLSSGDHEIKVKFDNGYLPEQLIQKIQLKAAETETVFVVGEQKLNKLPDYGIPTRYLKAIEFLEYLKNTPRKNFYDESETVYPDVDKVLSYVSPNGVSIYDINEGKTRSFSISQLRQELARRDGRAFRFFAHIGNIYTTQVTNYSSIEHKVISNGIVVTISGWYDLTFFFERNDLRLNKIAYLMPEGD